MSALRPLSRVSIVFALMLTLLTMAPLRPAGASTLVQSHLAPLKRVQLIINIFRYDGGSVDALERALRGAVETKLRAAGLVITDGESISIVISGDVLTVEGPGCHGFAIASGIEIHEPMKLARDESMRIPGGGYGTSWKSRERFMTFTDRENLERSLTKQVLDLAEDFVETYEQARHYEEMGAKKRR